MKMNSDDLFILVLLPFIVTEPVLTVPSVKVKLNQTVTLPCRRRCSGLVRWTTFHHPDEVVAGCDEASCWWQKGFLISHSDYAVGDLALTVTAADYSKRSTYICNCEGKDVCYQRLSIQPVMSSLLIAPGEDVLMDLPVPDPVELLYGGAHSDGALGQICMVLKGSLQCSEQYEHRWSFRQPSLTLRGAQASDSGLYVIQDMKNNEIIHIYSVSVHVEQLCVSKQQECDQSIRVCVLLVVMVMLTVLNAVICRSKGARSQCRRRSSKPGEEPDGEPEEHGAEGSKAPNLLVCNEEETEQQTRRRSRYAGRSLSDPAVSLQWFEMDRLKYRRTQNRQVEHVPLMSELKAGFMPLVPEEQ